MGNPNSPNRLGFFRGMGAFGCSGSGVLGDAGVPRVGYTFRLSWPHATQQLPVDPSILVGVVIYPTMGS